MHSCHQQPPRLCPELPFVLHLHLQQCVTTNSSNSIIKFADETVVVGLTMINEGWACLWGLAQRCLGNSPALQRRKVKEMVMDFRTQQASNYCTLYLLKSYGIPLEIVANFIKPWSANYQRPFLKSRKQWQWLYYLKQLWMFMISAQTQRIFYISPEICSPRVDLLGTFLTSFGSLDLS